MREILSGIRAQPDDNLKLRLGGGGGGSSAMYS